MCTTVTELFECESGIARDRWEEVGWVVRMAHKKEKAERTLIKKKKKSLHFYFEQVRHSI